MGLKVKRPACCGVPMKAYVPYEECSETKYRYPGEMEKILGFLNANGQLNVTDDTIERLYGEFSENRYCASWMTVDENLLEEFAEWLSDYDI